MNNKNKQYEKYLTQQNWKKLSKLITEEALIQDSLLNLPLNHQCFGQWHPSTCFGGADQTGKALQMKLRFLGLQDIKKENARNLNALLDNGQSVHDDEVNRTAFGSLIRLRQHFYPTLFTKDNSHVLNENMAYQKSKEYQDNLETLDAFFKDEEQIRNVLQFEQLADSTKKQLEERFVQYAAAKQITITEENKTELFQDFIINQGVMAYYRSVLEKSTNPYPSTPEPVKDAKFAEPISFQSSHLEALHFSWRMIHGTGDSAPLSVKNAVSTEDQIKERNELLSSFLFETAAIQLEYPVRADTLKQNGDTATCSCGQGAYARTLEALNYQYDESLSHVTRFKDLDDSSINEDMVKAYYQEYLLIALNDPQFKDYHAELLLCYPFSNRNDVDLKDNGVFKFYSPMHQAFVGRIKQAFFDSYKNHFRGLPEGYALADADFAELDALTNDFCFFSNQLQAALLGIKNNEVSYVAPFHPLLAWLEKPDSLDKIIQNPQAFAILYAMLFSEVKLNSQKEGFEEAKQITNAYTYASTHTQQQDNLLGQEPWFEFYSLLDAQQKNILWHFLYSDLRIKKTLYEHFIQQDDIQNNPQLKAYFDQQLQLPELVKDIPTPDTKPFGSKLDLPTQGNINQPYLWNNETRLHRAVLSGNINLLKRVLNTEGCDLILKDAEDNTALHLAAKKGNIEATATLLEKLDSDQIKELLAIQDDHSKTPLDWAAYQRNVGTIKTLLEKLDATQITKLLAIQDKHGTTPLHCAVFINNPGIILEKIDAQQIKELLAIQDEKGLTPLHCAVKKNNLDTIKALIEKLDAKQIQELFAIQDQDGHTPLHCAVQKNNLEITEALLNPLHPDQIKELLAIQNNEEGWTPLQCAACKNYLKIVEALLNPLNPNQIKELLVMRNEDGETLLHLAVNTKKPDVLTTLLEKLESSQIKELLAIKTKDGCTALHRAACRGKLHAKQIRNLLALRKNKDVDIQLQWAADNNATFNAFLEKLDAKHIQELLAIQKEGGATPLHWAAENNNPDIINAFFEKLDAKHIQELLAIQDEGGATPLHWAAEENNPDIIKAFFKKLDANQIQELLAIPDQEGLTPLHCAVNKNNPDIINALLEKLGPEQRKELLATQNEDSQLPLHQAVTNNKSTAITTCFDQLKDAPREEELEQANDGQTSLHKKMKLQ